MKTVNDQVVTSQSLSANFASDAILVDQIYGFSMHLIYTGTPSGILSIECSNDPVQRASDIANWTPISGATVTISAAGDTLFNVDKVYFRWIRIKYTFSSSTGSLSANYFAKGV